MKVLFLDFDGVLNSLDNMQALLELKSLDNSVKISDDFGQKFDTRCIYWLEWIVKKTDCKFVVSSSWRIDGLGQMRAMWKARKLPGEIMDITPSDLLPELLEQYGLNVSRGHEIQQWMIDHSFKSYCIVDDDSDMLEHQLPYFVQTNKMMGLNAETARQIVAILNI